MKTFRALHTRFLDFNLSLQHNPEAPDYPYTLDAVHGRDNPRINRFINLIAVENYLQHEERESGQPHVVLEADDGMVTININGTDMMLPRGSSIEDAMKAYDDRDSIGTMNINVDEAAYLQMLTQQFSEYMMQLSVDPTSTTPFLVYNLENTFDEPKMFKNSSAAHKYLRTLTTVESDDHEANPANRAIR